MMNDRFKFRAWNKLSEKFTYFDEPELQFAKREDMYLSGLICPLLDENQKLYFGNYELQQCTGLKDKNGKLIYEEDIVKFGNELFGKPKQIEWNECHYKLKNTFIILCDMEIKQFGLEIIGNIYENPELIGE